MNHESQLPVPIPHICSRHAPSPVASSKKPSPDDRIIENRKARFDYAILDTIEVGIVLRGSEVKSVRDGQVSLNEGFVRAEMDPPQLLLHGVHIAEYAPSGRYVLGSGGSGGGSQHRPTRTRVLLAHKKEIVRLAKQFGEKGVSIVPLKLYFKNGYAKLLIGVGKGKSKHDKRQSIGKREAERDIQRAMSRRV